MFFLNKILPFVDLNLFGKEKYVFPLSLFSNYDIVRQLMRYLARNSKCTCSKPSQHALSCQNFKAENIKYSSALVFRLNRWKSTQLHSALNKDGGHARVYQTVFFKYLRAKRLKKFYQRNEKEQCGTHSLGCLKLCTIQEKNYN